MITQFFLKNQFLLGKIKNFPFFNQNFPKNVQKIKIFSPFEPKFPEIFGKFSKKI
jgi:hypothetical protein